MGLASGRWQTQSWLFTTSTRHLIGRQFNRLSKHCWRGTLAALLAATGGKAALIAHGPDIIETQAVLNLSGRTPLFALIDLCGQQNVE